MPKFTRRPQRLRHHLRPTALRGKPGRISTRPLIAHSVGLNSLLRKGNLVIPKRLPPLRRSKGVNQALNKFYRYSTRKRGIIGILGTLAGEIAYRKIYNYLTYNRRYRKPRQYGKTRYYKKKKVP